ncbi:type VI secretion system contractile sheath large subunit [Vibrio sp. ZSDE26]|uniref:Type VI secretion system contractile sheath large subunit n=1 Tax=Vibrio amylolyticus TaxID=2847292 RepID=A0A9X2BIL1_9VIBR|nr:type VI secretion system contractile sheath large subunit [Vibrio amylolyticus]MCK6265161.1 type VI secretion system contractile sheath large subunit [Vibrio amylolyticus]
MQLNTDWQETFNQLDDKDNAFMKKALSLLSELDPNIVSSASSLVGKLSRLIANIDQQLSNQLNHILHADEFEELHSNWLGLEGLIHLPVNSQRTKIRMLDMSWHEISSDVNQAYSTKSSHLYNLIGNKELNTLGGQPFGTLLFTHPIKMDMDFDADYDDLFTLELLGKLGETTLCPILLAPDNHFFVNEGADWLSDVVRIEKILAGPDFLAWQQLRKKSCSRFVALVMPSIRMRERYQNLKAGFIFNETGSGLWGNAVFAFASTIIKEHHRVNWFGFLKSRWNDRYQGSIVNTPNISTSSHYLNSPTTKIMLFGQISSFYAQQGFVPLTKSPLSDKYYFNGNNSIWKYGNSDNEKVLTQIQTTLMSCRIAHYLKVQVREMIGSFSTAAECEVFLTQWIEKFSSNVSFANEETLAKYPLSFAKIQINESKSHRGHYSCTLRIVPQYQYDHFSSEVVLTTDLDEVA